MECKFKKVCSKFNTDVCNEECFSRVILHGPDGKGGYWSSKRTPKRYDNCSIDNIPFKADNPKAYDITYKYCNDVLNYVLEKRVGLFLFSVPTADNKLGTGTGKTTMAITILNEYMIHRVKAWIIDDYNLGVSPAVFIKLSELQNTYNAQFRGGRSLQDEATAKYYDLKKRMMQTELLVLDDVGVRDLTDSFKNELFEIVDHRSTEDVVTIYTSNYPLEKLTEFLGERIVSRIDGASYKVGLTGTDKRKGGIF